MGIAMDKFNIRRLLTGLGLLVVGLLAVAFVLGLERTRGGEGVFEISADRRPFF